MKPQCRLSKALIWLACWIDKPLMCKIGCHTTLGMTIFFCARCFKDFKKIAFDDLDEAVRSKIIREIKDANKF